MANYYATARSNYFAVKDETAFREWAARIGLNILDPTLHAPVVDGNRRFGIAPGDGDDSGAWPTSFYNDDTDDFDDIDVSEELSVHLADGEVAILMEVGNEKLRYVSGSAVAVNNKGKSVYVNIDSIYSKSRKLGKNITRAEY